MPRVKITKRALDALPTPATADAYHWDTSQEGPQGFGVRVTPKGVKSFVYQFRLKGRAARRITLGRYGALTPDKARKIALDHSYSVARGEDPVAAQQKRSRDAATLGFKPYVDRFVDGYLEAEWPDSWQDAKARLTNHVVPLLGAKALPEITSTDIGDVIDPLRSQRALARNVYVLLKLLFDWAAAPERRDIDRSPMAGMKAPPAPRSRKRVLSPDEIIAAWRASYSLPSPQGEFIRLLFATLQRRNEVAGLAWPELGHNEQLWRLPGERAKNNEDHLVPLNALAIAELDGFGWKRRGLVITTTGATGISGFSKLKKRLDDAMLPILQEIADKRADALGEDRHPVTMERWTLHDIRRSGTTALQALGVVVEVTERVINHRSGEVSGIKKVYNLWAYEPEKRDALNRWGSYLERLIAADASDNVVALAGRRA